MTADEKTAQEARALAGRLGLTQHLDTRLPMIESFLTTRESALRAEINKLTLEHRAARNMEDILRAERDALQTELEVARAIALSGKLCIAQGHDCSEVIANTVGVAIDKALTKAREALAAGGEEEK